MPKKPHRNPLPMTPEDSSSYDKEESERRNRSSDWRSRGKSSCDSGYTLAQMTGVGDRYPARAGAGARALVTVSPTDATPGFLIPVTTYPIPPIARAITPFRFFLVV